MLLVTSFPYLQGGYLKVPSSITVETSPVRRYQECFGKALRSLARLGRGSYTAAGSQGTVNFFQSMQGTVKFSSNTLYHSAFRNAVNTFFVEVKMLELWNQENPSFNQKERKQVSHFFFAFFFASFSFLLFFIFLCLFFVVIQTVYCTSEQLC